MKRITLLVSLWLLTLFLPGFVSISAASNSPETPHGIEAKAEDSTDLLVNGLIDLLAGAYDKNSQYYDKEFGEAMKRDLQQLLVASRAFVLHDDFRKVIVSLNKILSLNDSSDIDRNTFAKFLKQVLKGGAPLADSTTLKGMLLSLASIDKSIITGNHGVIAGLNLMAGNNIYGQNRKLSDLNTSALRSLLFMIACADLNASLEVSGKDTGIKLLLLVDSADHPSQEPGTVRDQTHNLADWFIGEIVTAVRWGREGKIRVNGKYVHMDQFQAYDWLMFKKKYLLSGVGYEPLKFEGIVGMISHPLVQSLLPAPVVEAFPALIELSGGMSEAEYHAGHQDGFTNTSWRGRYGTAGRRHKLLALFTPIMEYWWNLKDTEDHLRVGDLVHMLAGLNEIPVAEYQSLEIDGKPNPQATLRNDAQFAGKSVLKTIEDSGLLSLVLRSHAPNDSGLAPPAVDLFVRLVNKLNSPNSIQEEYLRTHPAFSGSTYLDIFFAELDTVVPGAQQRSSDATVNFIDRVVKSLFVPLEGERNSLVSKLGSIIQIVEQISRDEKFASSFRQDLGSLIDASEKLLMSTDIEPLLGSLNAILALNDNPDPQKNTLAKFTGNALRGLAPISDGDTLKGLILALATMDSKALRDTAKLNEDLMMVLSTNMYGQKLESAEIKTSEFRTLLFMIQAANVDQHLVLARIDTRMPLLRMVDSPQHPAAEPGTVKDQTTNIAQWAIGEIVTAMRWGREGSLKINGTTMAMDQFQAFDWVMYKKRYDLKFAGIRLLSFDGMVGLLSSKMVQAFIQPGIIDAFPALVDLGGGMTDAEFAQGTYKGFTNTSWKERYGTAGRRHKMLAIIAPLLEFSWNNKDAKGRQRSGDMIQVLAGLNEMPMPPAYRELKTASAATFRRDDQPSVLKTVEDSGILVTLVKTRGESDIVVPSLDLLITVVAKLNQKDSAPADYKKNHPEFAGNTLLDVLFAEMDIKGYKPHPGDAAEPVQQIIDALFTAKSEAAGSKNVVARLQAYLQRIATHIQSEAREIARPGSGAATPTLLGTSGLKGGLL